MNLACKGEPGIPELAKCSRDTADTGLYQYNCQLDEENNQVLFFEYDEKKEETAEERIKKSLMEKIKTAKDLANENWCCSEDELKKGPLELKIANQVTKCNNMENEKNDDVSALSECWLNVVSACHFRSQYNKTTLEQCEQHPEWKECETYAGKAEAERLLLCEESKLAIKNHCY